LCWCVVGNEARKFDIKQVGKQITTVKALIAHFGFIFIIYMSRKINIEFPRSELPCFTNHISSLVSSQIDHSTNFLPSPGHPPCVWTHFPVFKCFSECPGKHQRVKSIYTNVTKIDHFVFEIPKIETDFRWDGYRSNVQNSVYEFLFFFFSLECRSVLP